MPEVKPYVPILLRGTFAGEVVGGALFGWTWFEHKTFKIPAIGRD